MTGEISLRGKVLPIGGLKEKVLAAHRAGIRTVILPKRNEDDLEDLTEDLRAEMTFVPVDDARDVLKEALEGWAGLRTTIEGLRNTIATTTTGASPNVIPQGPGAPPAPMPPSSSNVFPTPPIQRKE